MTPVPPCSEKVGHQNHFHIDLRTPTIRALPNNLLADHKVLDQTDSVVNETLRTAAQGLLREMAAPLTVDQGDLVMFVMDVPPDVPPQYAPIVVAEAAQAKNQTMERTIGVCQLVSSRPEERLSAVNSMSPRLEASAYLRGTESVKFDWKSTTRKMTLLEPPKHGTLAVEEGGSVLFFRPQLRRR